MLLFDLERQLKAILWTKFTRINPRTGKKEPHPADFLDFMQQVLVEGISLDQGLTARLADLRS